MRTDVGSNNSSMEEDAARLLKVAWLTFPIGILFTSAACLFVFWFQKLTFSDAYAQAILIHGLACILELLSEPVYILSQNFLLLKLRLIVETAATLLRCMTTYILIFRKPYLEKGIVFALSQASYGSCLLLGYWAYFLLSRTVRYSDLFPFRRVISKDCQVREFPDGSSQACCVDWPFGDGIWSKLFIYSDKTSLWEQME